MRATKSTTPRQHHSHEDISSTMNSAVSVYRASVASEHSNIPIENLARESNNLKILLSEIMSGRNRYKIMSTRRDCQQHVSILALSSRDTCVILRHERTGCCARAI